MGKARVAQIFGRAAPASENPQAALATNTVPAE